MPRICSLVLPLVLAAALLAAPGQAVASSAATPIPVTAKQHAAVDRLTGYAVQLVAFTRQVSSGVELKEARIRTLRTQLVRWIGTSGPRFAGRLLPVTTVARRAVAVLSAIEAVETRGGEASTARYRSSAIAFDAAVTRFSALRLVQRSR